MIIVYREACHSKLVLGVAKDNGHLVLLCLSATKDILHSYERRMVDLRGVEPLTSAMRMRRSSQLSYKPL